MLSQNFIDEMKQQLLSKKKQLEDDLAGLTPHTEMGDEEDENASEVEVDESNQDVIAVMQADLARVNKALMRIEDGSYGTDDDGTVISEDRLRAIPWADKAI